MSAVVVNVRAELEARAGASDNDEATWKAERRGGVTATDMLKLYTKRVTKEALASEKLAQAAFANGDTTSDTSKWGATRDFVGNVFTRWGKEREPIIAAAVQKEHGIAPESRVFRSAANPRWLASPDGIGIDFDERISTSEIKTSGDDIAIGSKGFEKKGYLVQMVWAMGVIGAYRCRYEWEYRLGEAYFGVAEADFTPGQRQGEWVMFADHEQLWLDLQTIADDFLAELDRQAAGVVAVKHPALIRAESLLESYFEQKARSEANLAGLRSRIDEALVEAGVEKAAVEGVGTASVTVSKPGKRFDSAALRKAEPAVYARFQKETPGGERTLRLVPARADKAEGEVA